MSDPIAGLLPFPKIPFSMMAGLSWQKLIVRSRYPSVGHSNVWNRNELSVFVSRDINISTDRNKQAWQTYL